MRSLLLCVVVLVPAGMALGQSTVDFTLQLPGGGTNVVVDPLVPGSENFQIEIWVQWSYDLGAVAAAGADTLLTASQSGAIDITGPPDTPATKVSPAYQAAYDTTDIYGFKAWNTDWAQGTALGGFQGVMNPSSPTIGTGSIFPITPTYLSLYYLDADGIPGTIDDTHMRLAVVDATVVGGVGIINIDPMSAVTMQMSADPTDLERWNATSLHGITVEIVPEPAAALLLLGGLPFLRRRR